MCKMIVKNNLAEILENRSITKMKFAEDIGITRQALGSICNGTRNASLEVALKISKALNLAVEEIFYLD